MKLGIDPAQQMVPVDGLDSAAGLAESDMPLLLGREELAGRVLSGEPSEAPRGLRLLIAGTPSKWVAATKPRRAVWTGRGWDKELAEQPRVALSAPPFAVCLVVDGTDPCPGFFDTAPWLSERAGKRRFLTLELPLVETLTDDDVTCLRELTPARV